MTVGSIAGLKTREQKRACLATYGVGFSWDALGLDASVAGVSVLLHVTMVMHNQPHIPVSLGAPASPSTRLAAACLDVFHDDGLIMKLGVEDA